MSFASWFYALKSGLALPRRRRRNPPPGRRARRRFRPRLEVLEDRAVPALTVSSAFGLGALGEDHANAVATDAAGNVYLLGEIGNQNPPPVADLDPGSGVANVGAGAFVAKYSPAGALLWAQSLLANAGGHLSASDVAVDAA